MDGHITNWTEAEVLNGSAILIVLGYGLPELIAQRAAYQALVTAIIQLEGDLTMLRQERDGIWGLSPQDDDGIWFRLAQYKALVRARLGAKHPLSRTVPNFGDLNISRYLTITQQFIDHWERVNAALPSPLTLGTFVLASLQTAYTNLEIKLKAVESSETSAAIKRAEHEQLFGDEAEELREATSIVARLVLYQALLSAMFPNQPIADTLPPIFPASSSPNVASFGFNWVAQPGGIVKVWYDPPSPAVTTAEQVFFKEGAFETTAPVTGTTPGSIQVHNFTGVTIVGELDELELHNAAGLTVAHGTRNAGLPEPT
ncbi:MAG: hypothetical protein IAG10_26940 [Planctomycetaceae bacterium]|nr:hypothetical protein [Planctomycetaceae bacterium]